MFSIPTLAASYSLSSKLDPDKTGRFLDGLGVKRSTILDYVYPNNVKLATVQMRLSPYKDLSAFVKDCCRMVDSAVRAGSHLVLFPHLLGLSPLSVDKSATRIVKKFIDGLAGGPIAPAAARQQFSTLIERFADFLFDCYYNVFLLLAHRYNIYIAAGSTYVSANGGTCCRSYLFSPDHPEAFHQDKIHLTPLERLLGVKAGDELNIIDLKIGKIVLLADIDAMFHECYKVAKSLGAQIVLTPALLAENIAYTQRHNASLIHAQHYSLITARSSFYSTGELFPAFGGASGIYAPQMMTREMDGIVVHNSESTGESRVLCARVDPPKLLENMDVYAYSSSPAFSDGLMNDVYPAFFGGGAKPPELRIPPAPILSETALKPRKEPTRKQKKAAGARE